MTATNGAFLRNPRGGVEDVAEMKAAGIAWLALNVGDDQHWDDWQVVRDRADAAGVAVLPWARVRTMIELHDLMETADVFSSRVIANIENEFETVLPPAKVAALLADYTLQSHALDAAISTVGWVYNAVDYSPLANYPVLLQLFPQDMKRDPAELEQIQADCVKHARERGFVHVGITAQTYGAAEPSWYAYMNGTPRSYFTGDDIGATNWAAWGS